MDWARLTLIFYILMRMTGFVLFNPILGRRSIPGIVRSGMVLVLTLTAASMTTGGVPVPGHLVEFALKLLLELALGYLLGFVMMLFFYVAELAGEVIDTQMGMTMSKIYDPASQANMSVTSTLLNILMLLLFFSENGHTTLIRILVTSGKLIPYGTAALGTAAADLAVELFVTCTILGIKLAMPILAAELMGQVGMGILMKVIPQINVFAINIELKVIIGLLLLVILISPFSGFLLDVENQMLFQMQRALTLT